MPINKRGKCSECGKDGWITKPSLMLCAFCNKKRLDKKKGFKIPTGEGKLFKEIWEERDHVSFISGQSLEGFFGNDSWYSLFAHVLPKGRHPKLRLNKDNIILLTPFEHYLYDQGTESQREKYAEKFKCDWSKIFELKEKLLNEDKTNNG